MSIEIPESYKTGIQHIEELDLGAMTQWLRAELHEQVHVLAGQAYDYSRANRGRSHGVFWRLTKGA